MIIIIFAPIFFLLLFNNHNNDKLYLFLSSTLLVSLVSSFCQLNLSIKMCIREREKERKWELWKSFKLRLLRFFQDMFGKKNDNDEDIRNENL